MQIDQSILDAKRQEREKKAVDDGYEKKHEQKVKLGVQQLTSNLTGFVKLIEFLEGHTTKAELTNQLDSMKNPDVVEAVEKLKTTVASNKVNLKPLQDELKRIETQLSTLPRVFPEAPEQRDNVKVNNLSEIDTQSIVDAIDKLELNVEAPNVKVDAPQINVEKPDLEPIKLGLQSVVEAVLGIKWPEIPETDVKGVERRLDKANEHLKKLVEKPISTGGGGGGGPVFRDANNASVYPQLDSNGKIQISGSLATTNYATKIDNTTTTNATYVGKAVIGSSGASAVWQIKKLDTSTLALDKTWADGDDSFNNIWNNRSSLTYS